MLVEKWEQRSVLVSGPNIKGVTMATIYLSIPLVTEWGEVESRGNNYTVHVARIMWLYIF
jgi:hypothetical protein